MACNHDVPRHRDPLDDLVHDHADVNRRVLEIGALLRAHHDDGVADLRASLLELREQLFLHFAREEEGLFPFVTEEAPDLAGHVDAMERAHDGICGAVARMVYMTESGDATSPSSRAVVRGTFERFEAAYGDHARTESELLRRLADRLDEAQRARLAELVRGL